ncbi:MAG TPA: DNA-processing protein DprA, partial [Planctomycetia bacterium]|nr:DNA-processing protein DprA [Planctomycetia bacterium]
MNHWNAERLARLRLWRTEGVGPERQAALIERFGSAAATLAASRDALEAVAGIGPKIAAAIVDPEGTALAEREVESLAKAGVRWLTVEDDDYPALLKEIPRPPLAITLRGAIVPADDFAVAIVGSRRCSPYGLQVAATLARELVAKGATVVSGLARGIDGAAHRAALDAGGRTIAVLASGLGNIYPPEHLELAEEIVQRGALVSEAPIDGPPLGPLFPLRNRIISGLSRGTVVVEAADRSGALSTAHHALDQNREVFAVPGRIGDPNSGGCNSLLRKGATLVRSVDDILEQLGPGPDRPRAAGVAQPSPNGVAVAGPAGPPPGMSE